VQFKQVNGLGRLLKLFTLVRPSNATDPLLERSGLEERVLVPRESITQTHTSPLSRSLDERVVVEAEHLDAWIRTLTQALHKLGTERVNDFETLAVGI
jgi:hypothetical protein